MGRLPEREGPPSETDPTTWYTRNEAASLLGCSTDLIRHFERTGKLHAQIDRYGYHRFSPPEVLKLQERRRRRKSGMRVPQFSEGELEARAYDMYDAGRARNDVVKTLFITSGLAQKFWERWNERYAQRAADAKQQRESEEEFQQQQKENQKRIDAVAAMFAPPPTDQKKP